MQGLSQERRRRGGRQQDPGTGLRQGSVHTGTDWGPTAVWKHQSLRLFCHRYHQQLAKPSIGPHPTRNYTIASTNELSARPPFSQRSTALNNLLTPSPRPPSPPLPLFPYHQSPPPPPPPHPVYPPKSVTEQGPEKRPFISAQLSLTQAA